MSEILRLHAKLKFSASVSIEFEESVRQLCAPIPQSVVKNIFCSLFQEDNKIQIEILGNGIWGAFGNNVSRRDVCRKIISFLVSWLLERSDYVDISFEKENKGYSQLISVYSKVERIFLAEKPPFGLRIVLFPFNTHFFFTLKVSNFSLRSPDGQMKIVNESEWCYGVTARDIESALNIIEYDLMSYDLIVKEYRQSAILEIKDWLYMRDRWKDIEASPIDTGIWYKDQI